MNATVFKVVPLQGWISEGGFDPGLKLRVDLEKGLRPFSLFSSVTASSFVAPAGALAGGHGILGGV